MFDPVTIDLINAAPPYVRWIWKNSHAASPMRLRRLSPHVFDYVVQSMQRGKARLWMSFLARCGDWRQPRNCWLPLRLSAPTA